MTTRSKWFVIAIVSIVALGGGLFAFKWFASPTGTTLPLRPTQAMIQREATELRAAIAEMETQAQEATLRLMREALNDDYLSVQEEQQAQARSLERAGEIKARATFPAMIEGFVFTQENGEKLSVGGFAFDGKKAQETLEAEFNRRATAVKERELIELLKDMLRQNTQSDHWLDDGERDHLMRFITTPRSGKNAGLKKTVAAGTAEDFCRTNGIRVGQIPGQG